ncbi:MULTISPECIES: SDR family oxidoreductase [unclassified Arcicella]|uniref:SDR family oxidoreductase n=1 Tax=unclassified Arcicella TaxID=2644986 RepID=UPI0028577484|nr:MULTISPECIES: SDR family oxidoreductase [unclassified Arcicella]MDR6565022.1 NAD(P)-dependent dehydrogenase (short-subunit alcohol dehydrogenase family) [Arcicella sp. BE51]MDR6814835.1 NAD(P)-dependent dehydrogenase (short-subunit alcohol dehydrogenase family) [Arcicella sp. BE140]MDR6826277.1 NAD(P)-dependent dehydrogenase (short-subunit alcohol dehydrogenase family) [Arcicella sp. BE139]
MESLKGKKVVIIGGSSGIGLATAKAVSLKGGLVIIVSSNQQRIDKALQELPTESIGYTVDVTNEMQVRNLFDRIGAFDHLVFTAGESLILGDVADTTLEMARNYFNIRYWGAFTAVKYATPFINITGSIVLTSGIASNRPNKGWALGASICAAMEGFTRAMALELAPIRVNIVSPGVVKTELWGGMSENDRETMFTNIGNALPVKRVGEAQDIAKTFVYLLEQQYGTGQTLIIDGGTSLV